MVSFLALLVLLAGLVIYRSLKSAKEVKEIEEVFRDLFLLSPLANERVVILKPDDPAWLGKASHVKERLEFLIDVSQGLGLLEESAPPIKIGIAYMYYYEGLTEFNCIVLNEKVMGYENKYLDKLLVHEFSHVITWHEDLIHGKIWRKTYKTLLKRLD